MPYLLLLVNFQISDETEFSRQFSKVGAKALGKPEEDITTNITYNRSVVPGSFAFGLTIVGLGHLDSEAKEECKAVFHKFFTRKLGVPKDRGFIHFHNPAYLGPAI
ncbi:Tautomerase/MIF [Mycena venus]|uniref:Tautomerase/MIF n=1 Tax=Mycena venus TaxID=2733690 RepID=A0A8H6Y3X2_9AGAR|nr:Tautomerase/MIF [Mycena venus]